MRPENAGLFKGFDWTRAASPKVSCVGSQYHSCGMPQLGQMITFSFLIAGLLRSFIALMYIGTLLEGNIS